MTPLGYAEVIRRLGLRARPLPRPAFIGSAVNRRVDAEDKVLFPVGVAVDDTPVGHLEFGLRHEGVNLEVIALAFNHITPDQLIHRFRQAPNGEFIRRLCFFWEWLKGQPLDANVGVSAKYVDAFPRADYVVATKPTRNREYRVNDNGLGNPRFCPVVSRSVFDAMPSLVALLERARNDANEYRADGIYDRAIHYLYLSETRSNFAIEKETPSSNKEERFVQLLHRASEQAIVSEEWLVELQNAVVRDAFSREASYRSRQNWLEDRAGTVTFLPPSPQMLPGLIAGWEEFVNDTAREIDPLVKIACASFGFVYLHPFMDGNGRLHRFLIHQLLARSFSSPDSLIIPVSAVILRNLPEYLRVLNDFSRPVTALWEYRRTDQGPDILSSPGDVPYRFFVADNEVRFIGDMIRRAVEQEIPNEVAYLQGYDRAFEGIDRAFDISQQEISALIRMIHSNGGELSQHRRKQYAHLPAEVLDGVLSIVREAFGFSTR